MKYLGIALLAMIANSAFAEDTIQSFLKEVEGSWVLQNKNRKCIDRMQLVEVTDFTGFDRDIKNAIRLTIDGPQPVSYREPTVFGNVNLGTHCSSVRTEHVRFFQACHNTSLKGGQLAREVKAKMTVLGVHDGSGRSVLRERVYRQDERLFVIYEIDMIDKDESSFLSTVCIYEKDSTAP